MQFNTNATSKLNFVFFIPREFKRLEKEQINVYRNDCQKSNVSTQVMVRANAQAQVRDIFLCVYICTMYNVLIAFFNVWRLYIQIYIIYTSAVRLVNSPQKHTTKHFAGTSQWFIFINMRSYALYDGMASALISRMCAQCAAF